MVLEKEKGCSEKADEVLLAVAALVRYFSRGHKIATASEAMPLFAGPRPLCNSSGVMRWDWRPAHVGLFDRVVALLKDGLSPPHAAKELCISGAQSYRLRKRAVEMGLLG